MNNYKLVLSVAAMTLFVGIGIAAGPASAGIKCWTNDEGVKECGNVVPPEYSQKGHEELSEQGVTVKKTARAKTAEELAAEKAAKEQAARDQVLIDTFTTEDDLILTRDGKLQAIDTRIAHTKRIAAGLEEERENLEKQAADQERAGQTIPEELLADIELVERQLAEHMASVENRMQAKEELRAQFDTDLARYRLLKGN